MNRITRAEFIEYLTVSLFFTSGNLIRKLTVLDNSISNMAGVAFSNDIKIKNFLIRPPGTLKEVEFIQRCIRCGNCMKICLTNVLQPTLLETGIEGMWSPRMNFNISYCEYKCTLCTEVCPTGAIKKLTVQEKMQTKIGLAYIIKRKCIPYATDHECIVCEEHCPTSKKAIKIIKGKNIKGKIAKLPYIDKSLCVGCGICEYKCPVRPRAVFVLKS